MQAQESKHHGVCARGLRANHSPCGAKKDPAAPSRYVHAVLPVEQSSGTTGESRKAVEFRSVGLARRGVARIFSSRRVPKEGWSLRWLADGLRLPQLMDANRPSGGAASEAAAPA